MYPDGPYHQDVYPGYAELCATTTGRWEVVDGAIVGGQDPPGSGLGAYLLSDQVYGDFELRFDIKPDWPADTGVLVRATDLGSQGFQLLVDHRQSGGIGGFYGNGLGAFHALAFNVDAARDASGEPTGLMIEDPATSREPVSQAKKDLLSYAATPADFLKAWRWADWNTFTLRCVGQYPVLTSYLNGVKLYQLDTGTMVWPNYDREAVAQLTGRQGHIALEVHDNDPGMGHGRWAPGAVVRWRNLAVRHIYPSDQHSDQ
jgi:hypothetical protein